MAKRSAASEPLPDSVSAGGNLCRHKADYYACVNADQRVRHPWGDRRAGYNFDYKHSEIYRYGISHDRYVNDRFRDGYAKGYKDAYYGRRPYYGYGG